MGLGICKCLIFNNHARESVTFPRAPVPRSANKVRKLLNEEANTNGNRNLRLPHNGEYRHVIELCIV